jgi:hypothetical protein
MKKVLFIFLLAFAVYLTGCTDDDDDINSSYYNSPVISKTTDALAYSLVADYYTQTAGYNLSFTSDSLAYSLIVTNYFSGIGTLEVKDTSGVTIYEESLQGNKVISFTQADIGVPQSVKFEFDRYTGIVNFSMAKAQSN